jgi:large-conductance mechanosensitive channel
MPLSEIDRMDAVSLAAAMRRHEISPVQVTARSLERLEETEKDLNAFVTVDRDGAMAQARAAEAELLRPPGAATNRPLLGLPVSVKDLIDVAGQPCTFGSLTMKDYVPREDAPSVARLRRAGAVIVGKTTTPEFGWKGVTDSPLTGVTRNPWDRTKTPGGSSGGASAAVAAGMAPLALGTDGGGSIRIPAAFTGIVTSFTKGIVEPILALFGGGPSPKLTIPLRETPIQIAKLGADGKPMLEDGQPVMETVKKLIELDLGGIIGAVISFLITAAVVFFVIVKPMNKLISLTKKKEEEAPPAAPAPDIVLLTEIRDLLKK